MKCPPPSPAVLWFVNGCERKPRKKKKIVKKINNCPIVDLQSSLAKCVVGWKLSGHLQHHYFSTVRLNWFWTNGFNEVVEC